MKSKKIFISILTVFLLLFSTSAASAQVMWGKTELKKGQIGKITITKPINLWERDANSRLKLKRVLKPGEEYRVYRYDNKHGGQYGLGGGMWVTKMPTHIKYETPSKKKLALIEEATVDLNYQITKYGYATANYKNNETIRLKVGETIRLTRTDRLDRNEYYERTLLSTGAVDWAATGESLKSHTIIAEKPGTSYISILPLSDWDNEYRINIIVER